MLSDIERKILRIIANYSVGRHGEPNIHELTIKTGRDRRGVMDVLAVLTQERYIAWSEDDPDNIILIEAWERKSSVSSAVKPFDPRTSPFMD